MNRLPYSFTNCPHYQVVPSDYNGWQVQWREEITDGWSNLKDGWYKTSQEALDRVNEFCRG